MASGVKKVLVKCVKILSRKSERRITDNKDKHCCIYGYSWLLPWLQGRNNFMQRTVWKLCRPSVEKRQAFWLREMSTQMGTMNQSSNRLCESKDMGVNNI